MKRILLLSCALLYALLSLNDVFGAINQHEVLIEKMQTYEADIKNTYAEYQRVYYERKSSKSELQAFEDIITVYVSQILEIYDTISLTNKALESKARDIAARSLIYRALTYLEKAPLNIRFYEKACYDYYQALNMYSNQDEMPIILRDLPTQLHINNVEYRRLYDLIAYKGEKLFLFGKVTITLQNFKVTTNLRAGDFEFVRINSPHRSRIFTYNEANKHIKNAFNDIIINNNSVTFFLALPEGSYTIRNKREKNPYYSYLATIHVRANQQHNYIVEPLLDWIVVYENPSISRPQLNYSDASTNGSNGNGEKKKRFIWGSDKTEKQNQLIKEKIDKVLNEEMKNFDLNKSFNLKDPWIQSRFSNLAVETILKFVTIPEYFNCWDNWMLSWHISGEITDIYTPGKTTPNELVRLVKHTIDKL